MIESVLWNDILERAQDFCATKRHNGIQPFLDFGSLNKSIRRSIFHKEIVKSIVTTFIFPKLQNMKINFLEIY